MRATRREYLAIRSPARLLQVRGLALLVFLFAANGCGGPIPSAGSFPPRTAPAPVGAQPLVRTEPTPPPVSESDWLVAPTPQLRALTVIVKVSPPRELQAKYKELALRYRSLEPLFNAAASEGFGSGFVMVRRASGAKPAQTFVVTNRHVVGLASEATVVFEDARAFPASVVYVDDRYDLAILSLNEAGSGQAGGAALDLTLARDQDAVVASGYPGIDGAPSYQVTRGYVSNERAVLEGDEYVQHTAAIDPGSSGGPLFGSSGGVLGVNTLKVRGREAVGLAVPASAIGLAFQRVFDAGENAGRLSPAELALAACESLMMSVGREQTRITGLELQLGSHLVAENGLSSLSALPREDPDWRARFLHDPTGVFLRALALRLTRTRSELTDGPLCARTDPARPGVQSFLVKLAGVNRNWTFMLEQARWKLVEGSLPPAKGGSFLDSVPGPPKKWKPRLK